MQMTYLFPLIAGFSVLTGFVMADGRVRRVSVAQDQIIVVRTALGVATIIQVPDKPNSVVVGDLSAYKVEYLDTAITIKPMSSHAKSNLYIYTDYKRFNVQLLTGPESSADYVVYLENPKTKTHPSSNKEKNPEVEWTRLSKSMMNDSISLQVTRVGENAHGLCFIDFFMKSTKPEMIQPDWFWLTQNNVSHTIQGLVLSSLNLTGKNTVQGTIEVLRADLDENKSMRVEMRRKKMSYLTIKGVNGWKH